MLPPPGYFADSPWEPCEVCGTQRLKADKRPCRRCKTPLKTDLTMVGGGAPQTVQLLERWFMDSSFTYSLVNTTGNVSTVDATGPELRDASDATFGALACEGDGVDLGQGAYACAAVLGAVQSFKPVTSISYVQISIRGRVVTTGGATAIIHAIFDGQPFPAGSSIGVPPLPDDFLSIPPAAFTFTTVTKSYPLDPSISAAWDYTRIKTKPWGFYLIDQTLDVNSADEIEVSRYVVELYGPAA